MAGKRVLYILNFIFLEMKRIRLHIKAENLKDNQIIEIFNNDFDYLIKVMRLKVDSEIQVFNGNDGEFLAKISDISKKSCQLNLTKKIKEQTFSQNIILAFAPVKNVRIDFVASKATEMGVTKFQPIITKHSVVDKINEKKFTANIKEAVEQCERLDFPILEKIVKLDSYLRNLKPNQILILADESGSAKKASEVLSKISLDDDQEIIIFIGPEGGFGKEEFEKFYKIKNIYPISLGPRILRSDTAIISSLALVQEFISYKKCY